MRLGDLTIKSLPVPDRGQKLYSDDSLPGFAVRVSQGGTKTFLAVVGKERRFVTIGRYPVVTLAQARERARTILAEHQLGIVHKPAPTFRQVLTEYLDRRENEVRGSTLQADAYLFKLCEHLAGQRLEDISPRDIAAIIDRANAPSTKRGAYIRLSGLFSYAVRQGYVDRSPVKALTIPTDQQPRHRVLSDDELRTVLTVARMRRIAGDQYGGIVELLIYTGQRANQIGALHRSYVDFDNETIAWPAEKMKTGKRHTIPMGDPVKALLLARSATGFYFPNRVGGSFCGWSYHFRKLVQEVGFADWVLHDLRRTLATRWQEMGVEIATTEKMLSHSAVTGGLVGIYQRSTYLAQMRDACTKWEEYLQALLPITER